MTREGQKFLILNMPFTKLSDISLILVKIPIKYVFACFYQEIFFEKLFSPKLLEIKSC